MLGGRAREANYLCCTLVPRMPIEVETDWLIRKGSLLQKQCLLWSQAPLPVAATAGGQVIRPQGSLCNPTLSSIQVPTSPRSCLPAFSLFSSVTSQAHQICHLFFLCPTLVWLSQSLITHVSGPLFPAISSRSLPQYQQALTSTKH